MIDKKCLARVKLGLYDHKQSQRWSTEHPRRAHPRPTRVSPWAEPIPHTVPRKCKDRRVPSCAQEPDASALQRRPGEFLGAPTWGTILQLNGQPITSAPVARQGIQHRTRGRTERFVVQQANRHQPLLNWFRIRIRDGGRGFLRQSTLCSHWYPGEFEDLPFNPIPQVQCGRVTTRCS